MQHTPQAPGFRVELKVPTRAAFRAHALHEISGGGLFVRSGRVLPLGTKVGIELSVAGGEPVQLTGKVGRLDAAGFVVRLEPLGEAQWSALAVAIAEPADGAGEFECGLLAKTAQELSARNASLEADRRQLRAALGEARSHLGLLEQRLAACAASRERQAEEDPEDLRGQVHTLTEHLDEERLKNLALQRALERFLCLHGIAAPVGSRPSVLLAALEAGAPGE